VTHGYEAVMVRWLQEQGLQASAFKTEYDDERHDAQEPLDTNADATAEAEEAAE
jgi:putative mRNA 3-end processing factor